jgi:hypothetical protein
MNGRVFPTCKIAFEWELGKWFLRFKKLTPDHLGLSHSNCGCKVCAGRNKYNRLTKVSAL